MIRKIAAIHALSLSLCIPQIAAAPDELFPDQITVEAADFHKLGEYRYVHNFIFNLYDAALFVPETSGAEEVLDATTSFHLQFRYLRTIKKEIILKSADRMLEKNLNAHERERIADRVKQINQAYATVQEGDTSALTYHPDHGTTLRINKEPKLTIKGQDFAKLYFRIWLGPHPLSDTLKAHLLGRES